MNEVPSLLDVINEMRDLIDVIIKRGKPATSEEVAQLQAKMETHLSQMLQTVRQQGEQLLSQARLPYTIKVDSQAVATLLLGQIAAEANIFQSKGHVLINYMDERRQAMTVALDKGVAAVQEVEAKFEASAQKLPREIGVNWLTNWKITSLVALGPVVCILLGMLFGGHFSRVAAADFEELQIKNEKLKTENAHLFKTNEQVANLARFYRDQISRYRAKHKKSAADFPDYVPIK